MQRRTLKWLLAGVAAACVALAAALAALWAQPPSRITRENFDRIHVGMTRAEVEAILGPSGEYNSGPTLYVCDAVYPGEFAPSPDVCLPVSWQCDTGAIEVWIDSERVYCASFSYGLRIRQSPFENLLWRVKRWFPE